MDDQEVLIDPACDLVDDDDMVSSWTGISGVPGLGYSLPPKESCELLECSKTESKADPCWSANSAQHLAALKVDLPRVQHGGHFHYPLEINQRSQHHRGSVSIANTAAAAVSRQPTGVSAVNHLLSGDAYFERHNPAKSDRKQPLSRATVSSRLRSKLSLPAAWSSQTSNESPSSLPSHFIPRAPIPTPEVLALAAKQRKAAAAKRDDFSANNEAILKQSDQIYQSPKGRDGDYSYAYDCSISPAVVIKWTEDDDQDSEASADCIKPVKSKKDTNENIYEEIQDTSHLAQSSSSSSTGSSSANNSDSGIGHGMAKKSIINKGTLDVSHRNSKKAASASTKLSSLDVLLSQTSPELTPHQRLNLRKSLVDELFEELIQRHHKRVIDELRLDVEEFIAPPASSESSSEGIKSRLNRCESMDFKKQEQPVKDKKIGSKFWQSARKCSEVIQKKWKKEGSSTASASSVSQVTRRGHRPLSAIVSSSQRKSTPAVIDTLEDDSDNEQDAAARRLLRSQIIKSFWEQHEADDEHFDEQENQDSSERL